MIEFSCLKCGRTMKVADTAAGKKGQCKTCGAAITVPTPDNADTDPQPPLVVSQDNPPLVPRATPPALPRGSDGKSIRAGRVKGLLATPSTEDSPSPTESVSEESEPKRNIPVEALTRTSNWLSHAVGVTGTATAKIIAGMTTLRPKPTRTERGFDSQQIMAARIAAAGILLVAISPFFRMVSAGRLSALMIQSSVGRNLLISAVIAAVLYGLAMVKVIRRVPTLFVVQSWGILVGFQMGAKIWQISQFDPMPPPDNPFALMFSQQFTFSPGFGLYLGMTGGVLAASAVGLVLFRQLRSDASVALVYAIPCLACIGGVFIVFSTSRLNDTFPKPSNADAARIDRPGPSEGKATNDDVQPADPKKPAITFAEDDIIRVEVLSVQIGKVKKKPSFGGDVSVSKDDWLKIALKLHNKTDSKKLTFSSWGDWESRRANSGQLHDDLDNEYRLSYEDDIAGRIIFESVYPGKNITDLLVFEVPVGKAQVLTLTLPKRMYSKDDGELLLKIPMQQVNRDEERHKKGDGELAARLNRPGAPVGPVVPDGNGEAVVPIADAPQKQAEPPKKPADAWTTAGMTAENETVRVEVESVVNGKVKLKDFRGESSSEDELLQIKVRITNKSDAKKLDYDSWSASHGDDSVAGSLRDDLDNTYKPISFRASDQVVGQLHTESIYPAKSVSDLLVFEVPINKAQFIKLMLPVRAYGGRGDDELKLKIPTKVIHSSSAPVRADDAEDEAVAFVEKLKGTFKRDQALPGKPVIEVSLAKSQVTDVGLKELSALKNLFILDLGYTQVSDVGLKELVALKNLESLSLDDTLVTDTGLKELSALKNLYALTLSDTQVTDVGLKELVALKNLAILDLDETEVTDAGVKELVALKNLTILALSKSQVSDAGVKELVALKNLESLMLYGTQVTDVGVKELAALKKLTKLDLRKTQVTDVGVKKLQNALPKCKITN